MPARPCQGDANARALCEPHCLCPARHWPLERRHGPPVCSLLAHCVGADAAPPPVVRSLNPPAAGYAAPLVHCLLGLCVYLPLRLPVGFASARTRGRRLRTWILQGPLGPALALPAPRSRGAAVPIYGPLLRYAAPPAQRLFGLRACLPPIQASHEREATPDLGAPPPARPGSTLGRRAPGGPPLTLLSPRSAPYLYPGQWPA
jgi:hypothetical protein